MNDKEKLERAAVVTETKTWLHTPYHNCARIKGVGCDCGQILLGVFENCKLIPHAETGMYPQDWAMHHAEPLYFDWVKKYCKEVTNRKPLPGDILLYFFGRAPSHAAIVIDYPLLIHSYVQIGVVYADAEKDTYLTRRRGSGESRLVGIFSFWG